MRGERIKKKKKRKKEDALKEEEPEIKTGSGKSIYPYKDAYPVLINETNLGE